MKLCRHVWKLFSSALDPYQLFLQSIRPVGGFYWIFFKRLNKVDKQKAIWIHNDIGFDILLSSNYLSLSPFKIYTSNHWRDYKIITHCETKRPKNGFILWKELQNEQAGVRAKMHQKNIHKAATVNDNHLNSYHQKLFRA